MATNALPGAAGALVIDQRRPFRLRATGLSARLDFHLTDERLIALVAALLSVGFFVWYERRGLTVAFNDARSRELIARRVLMSRTPGLAQFGATWPPLLTMLMVPLIWIGPLFRDGLAGSLPSMVAYVVAAVYIYRTARLVTSSRAAGWVAAAALMLNPSLLYMQATPMSETGSIAAFVVAIYYGVRATHTFEAADVVKCAAAVAVGTLIRYEDWALAIAFVPVLAYVAWRRAGHALAEAWTLLYGFLGFAGCAAWIIYNWVIFHDPLLSFYYGQSSHTYYSGASAATLPARHHPLFAFKLYGLTVAETTGRALLVVAVLGLVVFVWRARLRPALLSVYLVLIPFAFYWLALYRGVNTESLPQFGGTYYNIRFGLAMVPAVALFAAVLCAVRKRLLRRALVCATLAVIAISFGTGLVGGTPFVLREAEAGFGGDTHHGESRFATWLSARYHGGNILYSYYGGDSVMFYLLAQHHFSDHDFITDSEGRWFTWAVRHPERWVNWIILVPDQTSDGDLMWTTLSRRQDWRRYFVLRASFPVHALAGTQYTAQAWERVSTSPAPSPPPALASPTALTPAREQPLPVAHAAPAPPYATSVTDSDDRGGSPDADDRGLKGAGAR
jgi:hypothetical protein